MTSLQVLAISAQDGWVVAALTLGTPLVLLAGYIVWTVIKPFDKRRKRGLLSGLLKVDGKEIPFHYREECSGGHCKYSHAVSEDERVSISFEGDYPSYQKREDKASEKGAIPAILELEHMEIEFFMTKAKKMDTGPGRFLLWVSYAYEGGFLHSRYGKEQKLFGRLSVEMLDMGSKSRWHESLHK